MLHYPFVRHPTESPIDIDGLLGVRFDVFQHKLNSNQRYA